MSVRYLPSNASIPVAPYNITLLSQRDVSQQVPINYADGPGVSVTAACFAHGRYELEATGLCLSNLLASGFRRLEVEIYWDSQRLVWSLCPVEIPTASAPSILTTSTSVPAVILNPSPVSNTLKISGSRSTGTSVGATAAVISPLRAREDQYPKRQDNFETISVYPTVIGSSTFYAVPTAVPTAVLGAPTELLISNGPYVCGTAVNLTTLTSLLYDFLVSTDTTLYPLEAHMIIITLNVHSALSYTSPETPALAPKQSSLPSATDLLGPIVYANLSSYLYTPDNLTLARGNLNASWLAAQSRYQPYENYYTSQRGPGNIISTMNGWPSEAILEFANKRRLLLGYGTIDPQMAGYNISRDKHYIFPPNYIIKAITVNQTSTGAIESGCLFNANDKMLTDANSSWVLSTDYPPPDSSILSKNTMNLALPGVTNLTACGISPFLNATLLNTTADVDIAPYRTWLYSSVWSWATDEPRDSAVDNDVGNNVRCAALSVASSPTGRWSVQNCGARHHVACRVTNASPFEWTISDDRVPYSSAVSSCPRGSTFSVPHTALENRYLLAAFLASQSYSTSGDQLIWLDFNDLDVEACWVTGLNSTCPYTTGPNQASQTKRIVVPTVAAIIVLVLALATLLVKCGANRSKARNRRKRGEAGWDYEGVPS